MGRIQERKINGRFGRCAWLAPAREGFRWQSCGRRSMDMAGRYRGRLAQIGEPV